MKKIFSLISCSFLLSMYTQEAVGANATTPNPEGSAFKPVGSADGHVDPLAGFQQRQAEAIEAMLPGTLMPSTATDGERPQSPVPPAAGDTQGSQPTGSSWWPTLSWFLGAGSTTKAPDSNKEHLLPGGGGDDTAAGAAVWGAAVAAKEDPVTLATATTEIASTGSSWWWPFVATPAEALPVPKKESAGSSWWWPFATRNEQSVLGWLFGWGNSPESEQVVKEATANASAGASPIESLGATQVSAPQGSGGSGWGWVGLSWLLDSADSTAQKPQAPSPATETLEQKVPEPDVTGGEGSTGGSADAVLSTDLVSAPPVEVAQTATDSVWNLWGLWGSAQKAGDTEPQTPVEQGNNSTGGQNGQDSTAGSVRTNPGDGAALPEQPQEGVSGSTSADL